jgi:hypothetical protein
MKTIDINISASSTITPAASLKQQLASSGHRVRIAQHKRVLHAALGRLPQVRKAFLTYTRALRSLPQAGPDAAPWLSVGEYGAEVTMGMSVRDLPSLKDKGLMRVLAAFAGDEWTATSTDYTFDVPNRDYRFRRDIAEPLEHLRLTAAEKRSLAWLSEHAPYELPRTAALTVSVYAYVKGDSDACRIEVTGVEEIVTKREVKKIVCA